MTPTTVLGGGGYNTAVGNGVGAGSNLGDNVLTGNTTGLSYFHGNSQTWDSNTFQGNTGTSASDRLNAIAGPVNYAKPNNGTPNYTTYYNSSNLVTPPANFVANTRWPGIHPRASGQPADSLGRYSNQQR